MPKTWIWYWTLTNITDENEAIKTANTISGLTSNVKEPYLSELRAFWQSPEMVLIQVEFAEKDMGKFAMGQAEKCKKYFGDTDLKFSYFAYWFDQAVINGIGNTPELKEADYMSVEEVFDWMERETGHGEIDFKKNQALWKTLIHDYDVGVPQIKLLILGMIRAKRSRAEYDTIVMNRRGTMAMGRGYVNGRLWDLTKELQ